MRPRSGIGSRTRILLIAAGCIVLGAIIGPPAVQAAEDKLDKISAVLVKNTEAEPVPVRGSVTLVNQPAAPRAPMPVQRTFKAEKDGLTVGFSETLYSVPADKVLTVEYSQISVIHGVIVVDASLRAGCTASVNGAISPASYELPAVPGGDLLDLYGGPIKLHVPGGGCLQFVATMGPPPDSGHTGVTVRGSITGYLHDVPTP